MGRRHDVTMLAERMLQDDAKGVLEAVIRDAKAGNSQAQRLVLERLMPARKGSVLRFDLPPIETADDVAKATDAVLQGLCAGSLDTDEANALSTLIEARRKAIELHEHEQRIATIEAAIGVAPGHASTGWRR